MNQLPVKGKQCNKTSPGPRDSGDGKSVHEASDEHGDTKIGVDDRKNTQESPRNSKVHNNLMLIDF